MRVTFVLIGLASLASTFPALAEETPYLSTNAELAMLDEERLGGLRHPDRDAVDPATEMADEDFTVEASLSLVSDFRRGGLSSTGNKAAVQGQFGVEHKSGVYGGVWASNIASNGGADLELDLALGYNFAFGDVDASVGVIEYVFPGVRNSSYAELQAGLSTQFGRAEIGVSMAYTPKQANVGRQDNLYVGVAAELPVNDRVALLGTIGVEDGAFGDKKVDWSLGATFLLRGVELGVTYVDSARTFGLPDADATLVFSVGKTF
jgi:uncharacterized protein (TIGR02001 family)